MSVIKISSKQYGEFNVQVDAKDLPMLNKYTWRIVKNHSGNFYAVTNVKGKTVRMHRFIMNAAPGITIDHIDRDSLNNQKSNLRACSNTENSRNVARRRDAVHSIYKGVKKNKDGWFCARIRVNGKRLHLGRYKTQEEAALRYNKAAKEYHGEFAVLNEIKYE